MINIIFIKSYDQSWNACRNKGPNVFKYSHFLFQILFINSIQESIDTMDMTEILQKRRAIQ